jgi:hypothetical protein
VNIFDVLESGKVTHVIINDEVIDKFLSCDRNALGQTTAFDMANHFYRASEMSKVKAGDKYKTGGHIWFIPKSNNRADSIRLITARPL